MLTEWPALVLLLPFLALFPLFLLLLLITILRFNITLTLLCVPETFAGFEMNYVIESLLATIKYIL